jgi:hypothetical protein
MPRNFISTLYVAALFVVGGAPHLLAEPDVYGPSLDPASQRPPLDAPTEKNKSTQAQATWRVINTATRPAPRDLGFVASGWRRWRSVWESDKSLFVEAVQW